VSRHVTNPAADAVRSKGEVLVSRAVHFTSYLNVSQVTLVGFINDFQGVDVKVQVLDGHQRYSQLAEGVRLNAVELIAPGRGPRRQHV
jgi:hypothetical protein